MKKILCFAAVLGFINYASAQNSNPWPTTGNVGIGTASPASTLQVAGEVRFGSNGTYTDLKTSTQTPLSGYNQTNIITPVTAPGSGTAKAAFYLKNAGSVGITRMDLLVDGNVGIGVTNPQNKVVVAQASSLVPAVLIQDSGTGDAGLAFNVSGASFTWGIDQSDDKKFKLSNSTTLGTNDYITVTNGAGNVGIGTANPNAKLDIDKGTLLFSKASANNFMVRPVVNSTRIAGEVAGTAYVPTADDGFLRLSAGGGTNTIAKAYIDLSGYSTVPDMNTNIVMGTQGIERMRINLSGNVSIGTPDSKGYKLAVNGSAVATSMTVKLNSAWPDYVFNKSYKLPSLTEVKNYIDENHHLPDMPSATQIEKEGLNLGEMNKILTKKVEELTLYLIEQNKRIEKLEAVLKKSSGN
jgi:hypothetical protein